MNSALTVKKEYAVGGQLTCFTFFRYGVDRLIHLRGLLFGFRVICLNPDFVSCFAFGGSFGNFLLQLPGTQTHTTVSACK
jgi:hypothetical protein